MNFRALNSEGSPFEAFVFDERLLGEHHRPVATPSQSSTESRNVYDNRSENVKCRGIHNLSFFCFMNERTAKGRIFIYLNPDTQ